MMPVALYGLIVLNESSMILTVISFKTAYTIIPFALVLIFVSFQQNDNDTETTKDIVHGTTKTLCLPYPEVTNKLSIQVSYYSPYVISAHFYFLSFKAFISFMCSYLR